MIKTKQDLIEYLEKDKKALGHECRKRPGLWGYEVWKFEIALRKEEYYANNQNGLWNKLMLKIWRRIHQHYGIMLGFDIPIGVFGPGLRINHYGYIVVNGNAKVGAWCDIHQGVNIGSSYGPNLCPVIGDRVWIGPGAKIYGKINIPDNCQIGANAVVNKSFSETGITIAGVPANKVSDRGNPYKF